MTADDLMLLPRWRCHKVVRASRISSIRIARDDEPEVPGDQRQRLVLECGVVVPVTKDLVARKHPAEGDYFVVYDDGYQSWSPALAFEDGYKPLV